MMTPDWSGFLAVIFACLWLLTAARNMSLYAQRDDLATRAIKAEGDALILKAHNADLRRDLAHAESRSVVIPLFPDALDERPGVETYGGAV